MVFSNLFPTNGGTDLFFNVAADFDYELHRHNIKSTYCLWFIYTNLKRFFKDQPVYEINEFDVQRYRAWRLKCGIKKNSINREHSALCALFYRLQKYKRKGRIYGRETGKWKLPDENPASLVKKYDERPFIRKRVLTPEEFKAFLDCAHESIRKICIMAVLTTYRRIDLKYLHKGNVNYFSNELQIIQSKTGFQQNIPLLGKIMEIVDSSPNWRILDFTNFRRRFEKAKKLSKVEFQFRDLRRTGGTWLLLLGWDLRTIQSYLGHANIRMTQDYLQPGEKILIEAGKSLEEKLKAA